MLKKIVCAVLAFVLLASCAFAEGLHIELTAPEGLREIERLYETEDGTLRVEVLTLEYAEYGMCNEGTFEELCELRTNCPVAFDLTVVSEEPFGSYPAKRVAYTFDAGDGVAQTMQAMAIWTDAATFAVFVQGEDDALIESVFNAMTLEE